MDRAIADAIDKALKDIIAQLAPGTRFMPKYDGEVLALDPDDDKRFVGGIFTYKDHVSLEFSEGAAFVDPDVHLEGNGKHRRHLTLRKVEEVEVKRAAQFIKQAVTP